MAAVDVGGVAYFYVDGQLYEADRKSDAENPSTSIRPG